MDGTSDRQFYAFPRLVKHVDDGFLAQVTQLYRERIQPGSVVLDLMSSWVSHLPPEVRYEKVVGHGLNAAELARNKQMDSFFVRDLNVEPDGWAMADQSVDAVVCCVSVQYMQQPERVFAEVYRVLKPGGVFILTFSNRMFYDKAISAWRDGTGYGRCQLVKQYFQAVEGYTEPEVVQQVPLPAGQQQGSGLLQLMPKQLQQFFARTSSDPFYAVLAYRNFKPEHS
ncbi:S-adenosyl-L-methionine-dependent methyltransferase [Scenedesmus sp. NREL 46B-D3]|nr:S-adenosyl-L-methionine-dependent methyltransferase [Scenedesmus sp. NREL 46B-D3]